MIIFVLTMGLNGILKALARELFRVTKPGGVVVWVVADATVNGSETGTYSGKPFSLRSAGSTSMTL